MIPIGASSEQIYRLSSAINQLRNLKAATVYRLFYSYYRTELDLRLRQAQRETPFAPSSFGRRKPRSGRVISDGLFGYDSGDMHNALVNSVRFDGEGFGIDGPTYTEYQLSLYRAKGPFRPQSPVDFTEQDIDHLIDLMEEAILQLIDDRLRATRIRVRKR